MRVLVVRRDEWAVSDAVAATRVNKIGGFFLPKIDENQRNRPILIFFITGRFGGLQFFCSAHQSFEKLVMDRDGQRARAVQAGASRWSTGGVRQYAQA
jgi:hypothetical protein